MHRRVTLLDSYACALHLIVVYVCSRMSIVRMCMSWGVWGGVCVCDRVRMGVFV